MKASHIAALALIATAATGFNAYAQSGDNYPPLTAQKFVSSLTRAQVQTQAVQSNQANFARIANNESGDSFASSPVQAPQVGLLREAVRAEAIKSGGVLPAHYNAS